VMMGYGDPWGYGMMGSGGWFWMLLVGLVILAGLVVLVIWAVRTLSGTGKVSTPPTSPAGAAHDESVAIAKRRLAAGEITPEQYQEIIKTLGG